MKAASIITCPLLAIFLRGIDLCIWSSLGVRREDALVSVCDTGLVGTRKTAEYGVDRVTADRNRHRAGRQRGARAKHRYGKVDVGGSQILQHGRGGCSGGV